MDDINRKTLKLIIYSFVIAIALISIIALTNIANSSLKKDEIVKTYVPPTYIITPTITPRPTEAKYDFITIKEDLIKGYQYREVTIFNVIDNLVLGKYDDRDKKLKIYTMHFLARQNNNVWEIFSETKSTWDCNVLFANKIPPSLIDELEYNYRTCSQFDARFGFGGLYHDFYNRMMNITPTDRPEL